MLKRTRFVSVLATAMLTTAAAAQPCEVPDNGGGTVDLPPPGCGYVSPDDLHLIIDGLPAGTEIRIAVEHAKFFNVQTQPGGIFGGEIERFDSILFMEMEGTGELLGFSRFIAMQVQCEVHTGPRNGGDPVQSFPSEMMVVQGAIFGDPDFDFLAVTGGTDLGLPSPGHTTLTRLGDPGSNFNVDSFFDIASRIEFVGAPGSVLDGMAGITEGTVRMQAGEPLLEDPCPFRENFDTYPEGSIIAGQGGWIPWDDDPAFGNAVVTRQLQLTPPHSLEVDLDDDVVRPLSGLTSGRWVVTAWQFIPDGYVGQSHFILLNTYFPTENNDWSIQMLADADTGLMTDRNGTGTLPLAIGRWAEIRVEVDLDLDIQSVFYDGNLLVTDSWANHVDIGGALEIAAIDLFANGASPVFYDGISICPDEDPCPVDIDGSGAVDFADINAVLANWGPYEPCPPYLPADLNRDCAVEFGDILLILANWGPCPPFCPDNGDPFTTLAEDDEITAVEFGSDVIPPLPPDFFHPGSEPFFGQVPMSGFLADPHTLGGTDTKVRRSGPMIFPGAGFPRPAPPVEVEIIDLKLTSTQPIQVGPTGEPWLMAMGLADDQQPGILDAVLEGPNGGSTQAIVPVKPIFSFARVEDLERLEAGEIEAADVAVRILDFNEEGLAPIDMGWEEAYPFSIVPPNDGSYFNASELRNPYPFFPGLTPAPGPHGEGGDSAGLPPHIAAGGPGHLHYVCPPPPPPPGLCTYNRMGFIPIGCVGGCPAPPVGKIFVRCPNGGPPPCPPGPPAVGCPRFIVVIFRCPGGGFCIAFYNAVACCQC